MLTGSHPLEPDHWEEGTLVIHESAWWLAPRRLDLTGSGRKRDLVYTAPHLLDRNPASQPGLFWLEATGDGGVSRRHSIDDRLPHPYTSTLVSSVRMHRRTIW